MPKRAVFEISRRELSLDVSVGVHILLVVEQSSLESQSRGCAKTPDTYGTYFPMYCFSLVSRLATTPCCCLRTSFYLFDVALLARFYLYYIIQTNIQ